MRRWGGVHRAVAAAVGGHRGPSPGAADRRGGAGDRPVASDDPPRVDGTGRRRRAPAPGPGPQPGGGRKRRPPRADVAAGPEALVEPTARGDPSRRCAGPARAPARWRSRCEALGALASATPWSPSCCTAWATACKATSRRGRAASIPIGTRSFATSRGTGARRSGGGSRQSRWIPRRRSWSGDFKKAGREWRPRRRRSACASTTSSFRPGDGARRFPTAFTICTR